MTIRYASVELHHLMGYRSGKAAGISSCPSDRGRLVQPKQGCIQPVSQHRAGGNTKRSWILTVSTVGFVSGLLFGIVAQGEPSSLSKVAVAIWRVARPYLSGTVLAATGLRAEGDGYRFFPGPNPADLTSPATRKKSDAELKTIHDGKPNMPPWSVRLSEKESRDVLAYVRTLVK